METESRPSMWERSTTHHFFRWLTRPRTIRRGLIGLAWMVTIIALGYGVVKWRGRNAWNTYRQNYESHIASLDLQTYIPKDISDAENFAATPFIRSFFTGGTNFLFNHDAYALAADKVSDSRNDFPDGHRRYFMDLAAWREAFAAIGNNSAKPHDVFQTDKFDAQSRAKAAPAVLEGLEDDQAAINELRAASRRPVARYPVGYNLENPWATLLPHLARIKQTCLRLQLQACAELALGQGEKGLADIRLILYMADSLKTEPWVISYLVRLACVQVAIQPIWEGLAEHCWSEVQLQELESQLQSYNFLGELQNSLHAERTVVVLFGDLLKRNGLGLLSDTMNLPSSFPQDKKMLEVLGRLIPSGWYDQEKLQYCLLADQVLAGAVDVAGQRVYPSQIALHAEALAKKTNVWEAILHHQFIASLALAATTKLPPKAAMAQTATDQAAIACALERYRLASGQFPENLSALLPRWTPQMPKDIITGEPYKYRRAPGGVFLLYSVGWNEMDDGGAPGKTLFDTRQGDWVWQPPLNL